MNRFHSSRCLVAAGLLALSATFVPGFDPANAQDNNQPPEGFTALFNGTDLSGWHGMEQIDPRELTKLSADELAAKKATNTESVTTHWTVENGEIVNDGEGVFLTTDEEFTDYELWIDYKTVAEADSGIYLKMNPQVQIWDHTHEQAIKLGGDKGSGGLWNNSPGALGKDPLKLMDKPFGEWNSFRIIQVGATTTVYMNDEIVVDHAIMENFWTRQSPPEMPVGFEHNKALPLFHSGSIQLQTHGGEIRWRNVFVKRYSTKESNAYLQAPQEHMGELDHPFNGTDLSGFTGDQESYEVVDGAIRCKEGQGGNLLVDKPYSDFIAMLEFKLPPGGNNGLAIRQPEGGDAAYQAMCELQILDGEHEKFAGRLDARQQHGSVYGMVAAHTGFLRESGQWNYQQVIVRGSTIQVILNGNLILDADLSGVTEFLEDKPHPGKDRTSGYFGFAGHSDPVEFRKIAIRPLEQKKAE